ncbi:MAG: phosphoenolpyruvate synthase [Bdellovibrionota bacterium]
MLTKGRQKYIRWFDEITIKDIPTVGGKTASLGEMYQNLKAKGISIPNGFGITASAYWLFLKENNILDQIKSTLDDADLSQAIELQKVGKSIRQAILDASIPKSLEYQINEAYKVLCAENHNGDISVAVRSSATAEDLPDASFTGQQETYLNVRTEKILLSTCKQCFASLFTDRAISYREHRNFDHFSVALSICVQRMVRSDLASSGVMFSIDTETGFKNAVLINASYGLGENIVQGSVNPDEFYVFKPTLRNGKRPILQKHAGTKEYKLIYDIGGSKMVKNIPVAASDRKRFSITDDEILKLARWACDIEDHYSKVNSNYTPMDMEWAKDGLTGELYILQARPETVVSQRKAATLELYHIKQKGKVLTSGRSIGEKISSGKVRIIKDATNLANLNDGEVLVTDKTDPDWEPSMKRASAIVTNRGGRTCHAAIVSRELGLPAIVGTIDGTQALKDGDEVTVSCAEGEIGRVYQGLLDFEKETIDADALKDRPKTQIMMNLANPEEAFRLSMMPNDGVGLARTEFIINHYIKIHPMALLRFNAIEDQKEKDEIEKLTLGYSSKPDYFIEKLAQGIAMLGAAFYPKDVIVRLSDFKTNEYANLIGGRQFEPHEENPMIGFRGASRYYNDRYRDGFSLECKALKHVRDDMGLTNVKIMIPFCRTVEEGKKVLWEMEKYGLTRGENNLEIYVMCEIPSNVILADKFSEIFDGFSIGSNDLTQLTLGVDRDSELLSDIFDERNEAVLRTIADVIQKARNARTKIGICGQAPSDYPEFAAFLVKESINSISLSPDTLIKTTILVKNLEKEANHSK